MKISLYLCGCGSLISDRVSAAAIQEATRMFPVRPDVTAVDYICSESGEAAFVAILKQDRPDRVVIAACSPRDHESTFRRCLSAAGINPYLLQIVNLREQIAWVTPDTAEALDKAVRAVRGAVERVQLQEALTVIERDVCPDVLIIGAGPAGISAARALAGAGRRVTLLERGASIGGMPVSFGKVFPGMECAPCMLEPAMMDILHGSHAGNIELLTLAEPDELKGSCGSFYVTVRQQSRHVSMERCIGCGECVSVCPAFRRDGRRAIDFSSDGALPHIPSLDETACFRYRGGVCQLCSGVCPVGADVIEFEQREQLFERQAGAVIVATGAGLYDCSRVAGFGGGVLPDVYDALQFQRLLSTTGSGGGVITTGDGQTPKSVAIIHCVGSLDMEHIPYCSGICCQYALTFSSQIAAQLPDATIIHFYRELVLPGKQGNSLHQKLCDNDQISFVRYADSNELSVTQGLNGSMCVTREGNATAVDLVVLCSALVPAYGAGALAKLLDVPLDRSGFFEESHERMAACSSPVRGIYPVGTCREPMDIQRAVHEGLAAAALIQAELQPGRKLVIEPIYAEVDPLRCSGCHICAAACPYRAISFDSSTRRAAVHPQLCRGCGACVAACPSSAIRGHGFTDEQILAEIKGQLT